LDFPDGGEEQVMLKMAEEHRDKFINTQNLENYDLILRRLGVT